MEKPQSQLIRTPELWAACLKKLHAEPRLAVDLEANSMYAYRERVCLIQVSIPQQDFIIDPLAPLNLD
ncbi:MAG: ribonuclease D, partial [Anaerolineales bacterium]